MKDHDSATAFTVAYFELLERHLHITWSDQGIPQCVIDWIADESVIHLRGEAASWSAKNSLATKPGLVA